MPDTAFETALSIRIGGSRMIAGIDEAGRGPWAGPVVASAVVLDFDRIPSDLLSALDDSKKLTRPVREELAAAIRKYACVGVGMADSREVDSINILQATMRAMERAMEACGMPIAGALVDGNRLPNLPCPAEAVVEGDGLSVSIAAASIVAKVTRDRMMVQMAETYAGYGWETNVGYGTKAHQAALDRLGATPEHRRSFAPIAKYCK